MAGRSGFFISGIKQWIDEQFGPIIIRCNLDRTVVIHGPISVSGVTLGRANHLIQQELLRQRLIADGVPENRVIILDGDMGVNGAVTARYSKEMARLDDGISAEEIGVVICLDVGRLFKDRDGMVASAFARRMAQIDGQILTMADDALVLLNMSDPDDNLAFRSLAAQAAKDRFASRMPKVS